MCFAHSQISIRVQFTESLSNSRDLILLHSRSTFGNVWFFVFLFLFDLILNYYKTRNNLITKNQTKQNKDWEEKLFFFFIKILCVCVRVNKSRIKWAKMKERYRRRGAESEVNKILCKIGMNIYIFFCFQLLAIFFFCIVCVDLFTILYI